MQWWTVPPEWEGHTAFILAGGPSVLGQDIDRLKGRNVIAINRSWSRAPFAQFLFFNDAQWWHWYGRDAVRGFPGRIVVTQSPADKFLVHERLLSLRRIPLPGDEPQGLSTDRSEAFVRWTSLTGAINLAVHLGAVRLVLLGADGKRGDDGRTHHHDPYPWDQRTGRWNDMHGDLRVAARSLAALKVECVNASPESAWADLWPIIQFENLMEVGNG